jgi:hypothetical protein
MNASPFLNVGAFTFVVIWYTPKAPVNLPTKNKPIIEEKTIMKIFIGAFIC